MAVVREAGGEGRAIVEGVAGTTLGELHLPFEGGDGFPVREDGGFFFGEVDGHFE